ncbi:hypothetical protein [Kordia zhangzhouensis]|nr:hypothetical protein [Kordia zhangzhouensis]
MKKREPLKKLLIKRKTVSKFTSTTLKGGAGCPDGYTGLYRTCSCAWE